MLEVKQIKTEPESINIRSGPVRRAEYKDANMCLCVLCGILVNVILIITGFWITERWYQLVTVSAFTILVISYVLVLISDMITATKKKSH